MRKLSTWFLSLMLVAALVFGAVAVMAADAPALPTANVSEIENEELTFALNFKAAQANAEQLAYYGDWYADFELTVNKDITLYTEEGADGYLSGQYDAWSENWVNVPFNKAVSLKAGETVKVMAFAAELMGKPGLKYTYKEVYESVKDFDCGMFLTEEYMQANPDLEVTLGLYAYNNEDEAERYLIGRSYTFCLGYVAQNVQTGVMYDDVSDAMQAAADGQTVRLLKNADELVLTVKENTTLDLNGHELAVTYASVFGFMEDNSAVNTGVLKVADTKLLINSENTQLPVKTEEGYRFVEVIGFNTAWMNENTFVFQPLFEKAGNELLKNGVANTGVSIQVEVTWKPAAGSEDLDSRTFKYGDTLVNDFIGSYNASTGKYGRMFTLALVNPDNYVDLSCHSKVVSTTRVEFAPQQGNAYVTEEVQLTNEQASAVVPVGTKLKDANAALTLNTTEMDKTTTDVVLTDGETMLSMDVHVDGVAADNTVPVIVTLNEITMNGLNEGNIALYHVENGETVKMNRVYTIEEVDEHNEYYYDIATGTITMALKSFSEIAVVSEDDKKWEGNFDYSWYTNAVAPIDGEAVTEYVIANADQLAALSAIVGGMDGQSQDSFKDKTVKLISDINLGDKESENNPNIIFYPIGYYNSEGTYERTSNAITSGLRNFEGTFDGNGHTVSNFYQNTWEMKGDHNWYSPEEQYYRDGMGLFGRVYGGTIKNLTVKNFSSDGEIATTGCIAAYADFGATFENIAIFNCNPKVYNIGNGGIVGCVGWYTKGETTEKVTFKNITVDNSNKISALWGSYDVACGGIVGQYYPTSGQSGANYPVNAGIHMENCHVSAQMDVYNDVCANYQYYAYRYTGMLIGSVRENVTIDGKSYPKMDGITAENCTIKYGDWIHYYYCELVANSLASYTHDHQFSRLTKINSLSEIKNGDAWSTTGNFLFNGECYHIVDKDGVLTRHIHEDAGTEVVEGKTVLKEDKQIVYLPYGQLFTGYGWGVTSKGLSDFAGTDSQIKVAEGQYASSVIKFEKADNAQVTFAPNVAINVGDLFKATGATVGIVENTLQVYVSPADENSDVSATYSAGTTWADGTLTFTGEGAATVTISDYFFCTPTTITVNIGLTKTDAIIKTEPEAITLTYNGTAQKLVTAGTSEGGTIVYSASEKGEYTESIPTGMNAGSYTVYYKVLGDNLHNDVAGGKIDVSIKKLDAFKIKFPNVDKYLYRVGNMDPVPLNALLAVDTNVDIGEFTISTDSVSVTTTKSDLASAKLTFEKSFTGPVRITVSGNENCNPVILNVEVVNAVNATSAVSAVSNNVVLLNDVGFSTYEVSGGYTLYGNGFKMTCANDSYTNNMSGYFVQLNNGTIDNVQIICPNFTYAVLYDENMKSDDNQIAQTSSGPRYYNTRSAVAMMGNSRIVNSYVSGGRAAIYATSGTPVIENSTIRGGAAANIHITSVEELVLKNTTLIQEPIESTGTYKDGNKRTLMGFSIFSVVDNNGYAVPVRLEGTFNQYAWAHEGYTQYIPEKYQSNVSTILSQKNYVHNVTYADGITRPSVNLGIVGVMNDTKGAEDANVTDNRINKTEIPYSQVVINTAVVIYSHDITNGSVTNISRPDYYSSQQGGSLPAISYFNSYITSETEYVPNRGWTTVLTADLDEIGDSFTLNFSDVLVQKGNRNLSYNITNIEGNAVGSSLLLAESGIFDYKLEVIDNVFYDEDGNIDADRTEYYTLYLKVVATKTSIQAPQMIQSPNGAGVKIGSKNSDWNCAIPVLDGAVIRYWSVSQKAYVELALSSLTPSESGRQNGENPFWEYKNADFTLTITSTNKFHDGKGVFGTPTVYNKKLYFAPSKSDCMVSRGSGEREPSFEYKFVDNNGGTLVYNQQWTVSSSDTYLCSYNDIMDEGGGCVTPDTLITLADGSKKRIDEATNSDLFLAWDFVNGQYTVMPAAILFNHGFGEYTVVTLNFSDGTSINTINGHDFFNADLNKFVTINEQNVGEYVGDSFVKGVAGFETVTLDSYSIRSEYTAAYSVLTAVHYNCFLGEMLTLSPNPIGGNFFMPFDVGEEMKFDAEKMQADIEKYGLFTYEEFADFATAEQFYGLNGPQIKVAVGKGIITMDQLIQIILTFLPEA